MAAQRLHATVRGVVQGVGYRQFVGMRALELGLVGWVRNDADGSVEVLVEGERPALDRLLAALWRGPARAQVHDVQTTWCAAENTFSDFHVRFGF